MSQNDQATKSSMESGAPLINPVFKSFLTSVLLAAATAATTLGVSHGLIPATEQTAVSNILVTVVSGAVIALVTWYKGYQATQKVMIKAVNVGDNGVKVVPETSLTPPVNEPLK